MLRVFHHYVPTPLLMLVFAEGVVFFTAVYLAEQVLGSKPGGTEQSELQFLISFALFISASMFAMGLYQRHAPQEWRSYSLKYTLHFAIGFIMASLIFELSTRGHYSFQILGVTFLIAFATSSVVRRVFLAVVEHDSIKHHVLILGTGNRIQPIRVLEKSGSRHHRFTIAGYLDGDSQSPGPPKISYQRNSLLQEVQKTHANEIVAAVRQRRNGGLPVRELLECKMAGVEVTDLPTFIERETGKVMLTLINPSWMVFSEPFTKGLVSRITKHAFDFGASLAFLVILAPPMLVIALLLKLYNDQGPVLYRQIRVGQLGRPFEILKFRTMYMDSEKTGTPQWAVSDDSRVTCVGGFLRRTRIDELPQLLNVLKGDMSFVGPRPERPHFVAELSKMSSFYSIRHCVKPGITGWAQIHYPYAASIEEGLGKLEYDLYYIRHHSFLLDLDILLRTAEVIIFQKGSQ